MKSKLCVYRVDFGLNCDIDTARLQLRKAVIDEILKVDSDSDNKYKHQLKVIEEALHCQLKGYYCFYSGCRYAGERHRDYVRHVKMVHPRATGIICKFKNRCARSFSGIEMLIAHLKKDHCSSEEVLCKSLTDSLQNVLQIIDIPCKCNLTSCGAKHFRNVKNLMTHFNTFHHLEHRKCIFLDCKKTFPPGYHSRRHFLEKHKGNRSRMLKEVHSMPFSVQQDISPLISGEDLLDEGVNETFSVNEFYNTIDFNEMEEETPSKNDEEFFLNYLADFLNRLAHMKFVPQSTVQVIAQEFFGSLTTSITLRERRLRESLSKLPSISEADVDRVVKEVNDVNDFYTIAHEKLNTEYKRNKYIQEHMTYVAPKEILLNKSEVRRGAKKDVVHYIPVTEVVKNILEDRSYVHMMLQKKQQACHDGLISDITDGSLFKRNLFFVKNYALPLLFYSDGVEVVNPLGAARGTYKIVQVFFTLINIPKEQRSKVDRIQLAMVFREKLLKKYGARVIFKPLIQDLKKMEEGIIINIPEPKVVKFGLLMYSADNLEASIVGGFSASFSSKSICRFCHCQYQDLSCKIHDYEEDTPHIKWTISEYDRIAEKIETRHRVSDDVLSMNTSSDDSDVNSCDDSDMDSNDSCNDGFEENWGLRGVCPFNELQAFHCIKGFPPDLLHDIMEGVVPEDLLGIIRGLSQNGWFTIETYNRSLSKFKWTVHESADKPQIVPTDRKVRKLKGKAVSQWTHIRNWPLIIEKFVLDRSEPFLLLGLKLHDIVERITAHEFHEYEIGILKENIIEYLNCRRSLEESNPDLIWRPKPKHHYLRETFLDESDIYI